MECFYYSKEFAVCYVPVVLGRIKGAQHEGDRMEVPLLIFLLEYCAQSIGRGICVYHKGFGEVWLAKYWGSSDSFF